jgi:hypothetical protein
MAQIIMDHGVSCCLGTQLGTTPRAVHVAFSLRTSCPRNPFFIEHLANRPMPIPISKSEDGSRPI